MRQPVSNSNAEVELPPSKLVRKVLGSQVVAQLCAINDSGVRKWDRAMSKGGTGGLVPAKYQKRLLVHAQANGLPLTAEDLIAEPVE